VGFTSWGGSVIGTSPELEVPVLALVLVVLVVLLLVLAPEPEVLEVDAGSPPAPPDPAEVRVPVPEHAERIDAATNVKVRTGAFDTSMVGELPRRPKRSAIAGEPNGRAAAIANVHGATMAMSAPARGQRRVAPDQEFNAMDDRHEAPVVSALPLHVDVQGDFLGHRLRRLYGLA